MAWISKPTLGTQLDWSNPLNTGLVGLWLFNEGSGDIVNDLSGNSNTGTLTNMTFPSTPTSGWNPGRLGPCIEFNGINNFINLGALTGFDSTKSITISAWIKFNDILNPEERYTVGSRIDHSSQNTIALHGHNGGIRFSTQNTARTIVSFEPVANNTWINLIGVRETDGINEILKLYLNNTLVGSTSYVGVSTIPNLYVFGKLGITNAYYHNGAIDEVRIWNRNLSDAEISQYYTDPYSMFLENNCLPISCNLTVA